ncbi:MAG: type II toxin-antitoxin system Phd/YefM family antitoxin [Actinomycetota bacterium]|nr:type II toxin-antitoxin system Phd/YefM family antitoxin [Actinomycetota bacterium]
MKADTRDMISIGDVRDRGVSRLVSDAENGRPQVLLRHNKAVAAIVDIETMDRLQRLDELEADLRLLSIALVRVAADSGRRYSFDEVLERSGVSRDELDAADVED